MIRRAAGILAWLITASMDALVVWALVDGTFLGSMLASLPAERRPDWEGMLIVAYAAIAGIITVTLAYSTVGLLLASRRGGGRVGAILLAGGATFAAGAFGYVIGGTLVLRDPCDPFDPVANVLFLAGPASVVPGYALILPVLALAFPDGRLPPLRGRVHRAMDRRFDRARYDGERAAAAFAERLRDEIDIDTLSAEVRRFAGETVRPASSAVWLRIVPDRRESTVS